MSKLFFEFQNVQLHEDGFHHWTQSQEGPLHPLTIHHHMYSLLTVTISPVSEKAKGVLYFSTRTSCPK